MCEITSVSLLRSLMPKPVVGTLTRVRLTAVMLNCTYPGQCGTCFFFITVMMYRLGHRFQNV